MHEFFFVVGEFISSCFTSFWLVGHLSGGKAGSRPSSHQACNCVFLQDELVLHKSDLIHMELTKGPVPLKHGLHTLCARNV